MNEVTASPVVPTDGIEVKHFAIGIDADGNEVQIEIPAEAVGYVQDAEEEAKPTVH